MAALSMEHVETECPICHENYIEPKILPCAHLLCRNCLISWVKTRTDAHCPLCRSAIFDLKDSNSGSLEDLADSLPTDHAMSAIVESYKIISQRQVCCVHTNTDAVSLCLQCTSMMCQSCVDYHLAYPLTSSHKIENLATLTSDRLAVLRKAPCSVHPNKTSVLFCSKHSVFICHVCASSNHRSCNGVIDLSEMVDKHKQSFVEMEDNLTTAESDLSATLAKYEEMVAVQFKHTKAAYAKIDSLCDDLILSVESCRNQLKKILKESEESFEAAIQDRKSYLAQRIGLVTSHKLLVKRIQQTASGSLQVAMATMIQDRIKEFTTSVSLSPDMKPMKIVDIKEETISFVKSGLENISHMIVVASVPDPIQSAWIFHNDCGSNIVLTNNRQTAEVKEEYRFQRVVVSSEPMFTNYLYEIKVEETITRFDGNSIIIGVCEENPGSFRLPSNLFRIRSFVGVRARSGIHHRENVEEYSCPALRAVETGSRIGVMVDTSHSLHVYVDGIDQGVMAKNVAQPCYAMFDLQNFLKKRSEITVAGDYASCITCPVNYSRLLLNG